MYEMDLIGSYSDDSDSEQLSESEKQLSSVETLPSVALTDRDNVYCKPLEHDSSAAVNYFSLTNSSTDSSDGENTCKDHTKSKKPKSEESDLGSIRVPNSKFWHGEDGKLNWHDEGALWGSNQSETCSNESAVMEENKVHMSRPGKPIIGYTKKHQSKTEILAPTDNVAISKVQKPCFIIHHRIAPKLQQNRIFNKAPKICEFNIEGHSGAVNRIQWCAPNYSHLFLTASMDCRVKVWNMYMYSAEKSCVQILSHHSKAVKDAKWSPSGSHILSCGYDRKSCLMDVEKGTCISSFEEANFVTCVTYHSVNQHLFLTGSLNSIKAWDCRTPENPIRNFHYKDNFGQVQDVTFVPDGTEFFSCNDLVTRDSADRNIMAWDFSKGVVLSNQIYQERYTCCRLKVHPKEALLLAQTQADYISLFSTIKPYKINKCKRYEAHKVQSYTIGFDISPDGGHLISGSCDGKVPIYDFRTSRVLQRLSIGKDEVCLDVAWHPLLSSTVAVVTWNGAISVWS